MLCGLLKPTSGTARILGHDIGREMRQVQERIGYLSQNFTLYGDLTIDENIEFFARIHGVRNFKPRREELLEFTRLTPFRRRLSDALSGGMKKKLALACTLIHTPDLILLDEPSTGVDPISRGEFWSILSEILARGVTILMTTPYLDEADRCERIALIHNGRVVMTGTPDDVKSAMPGEVFDFACANPREAYRLLRERCETSQAVLLGERLHVWTREGAAEAARLAKWLRGRGVRSVEMERVAPSLEDAFVALTCGGENTESEVGKV
jgi:ABC-2 type transport system ATP-binding protein